MVSVNERKVILKQSEKYGYSYPNSLFSYKNIRVAQKSLSSVKHIIFFSQFSL